MKPGEPAFFIWFDEQELGIEERITKIKHLLKGVMLALGNGDFMNNL